ncbi:MAG: Mov34/MPN/PAD-1 family protein [Anaeromyxobacteraceae bacterium]
MDALPYPPELLAHLAALCEASPAREACGFVVRRAGGLHGEELPNAADAAHAEDPLHHPRTSRDAYVMDPDALLATFERHAREGAEIVAVWHSHVEAPAVFSEKDQADAVLDGEPALPGAEQLVFSVRGGRVVDARRYVFGGTCFVPAALGPVPVR